MSDKNQMETTNNEPALACKAVVEREYCQTRAQALVMAMACSATKDEWLRDKLLDELWEVMDWIYLNEPRFSRSDYNFQVQELRNAGSSLVQSIYIEIEESWNELWAEEEHKIRVAVLAERAGRLTEADLKVIGENAFDLLESVRSESTENLEWSVRAHLALAARKERPGKLTADEVEILSEIDKRSAEIDKYLAGQSKACCCCGSTEEAEAQVEDLGRIDETTDSDEQWELLLTRLRMAVVMDRQGIADQDDKEIVEDPAFARYVAPMLDQPLDELQWQIRAHHALNTARTAPAELTVKQQELLTEIASHQAAAALVEGLGGVPRVPQEH